MQEDVQYSTNDLLKKQDIQKVVLYNTYTVLPNNLLKLKEIFPDNLLKLKYKQILESPQIDYNPKINDEFSD